MNDIMETNVPMPAAENSEQGFKKRGQENRPFRKINKRQLTTTIIVAFILMAIGSVLLIKRGITVGASALKDSYSAAYDSEKDAAYEKLYQSAFDIAEANYHVSNDVMISIGNLEESQKLEVLKVNDVEYITESEDDNPDKITSWIKATGEGTYVVDLQVAEFIVDNERRYVLVRIPNPELTNITLTEIERILYDDGGILKARESTGVDLAISQYNEAMLQIEKSLLSNQYTYSNAKDVAVSTIQNLVKQFNPEIPDLEVDVEFMD